MRILRPALGGWLLVVAVLAGCGDDDSADPDEDREHIEDALLTLDDLPDGFQEEPVDDDAEQTPCNDEVLGLEPDEVEDAKTAETDPVQFDSGTLSFRAQIAAFESDDVPGQIVEAFEDDEYVDCLISEFEANSEDVSVEDVDVEALPVDEDDGRGDTLVITIDVGGTAVEARTYAALVDRYALALQVTARVDDMDADLADDVLADMVDRLRDD